MKSRLATLALAAILLSACVALRPGRALTLHVDPRGGANADGTAAHPFATPEAARDHLRALRKAHSLPPEPVTVLVHGGAYSVSDTFVLNRDDSGTPAAPVVWRAAPREAPVFSGGARLTNFVAVADASLRALLPATSLAQVVQCQLPAAIATNLPPLDFGGFGSGRGFRTHPAAELFFNGCALPRAGWPDAGFATVRAVATNEQTVESHGLHGSRQGVIAVDGERLARWAQEPALWLLGYWFWDWADSYERVASIAPARGEITLAPPLHTYGYRAGQPFRAVNALGELDRPGEWFIDPARGLVIFYPPSDPRRARVELSLCPRPLARIAGASDLRVEGLTWELAAGDAVRVENAERVALVGCTVRNCGGDGIAVTGGHSNTLLGCTVHGMGRGGLAVSGGDRRTLERGGHRVEACTVYDLSRVDRTYTPAVLVSGVGQEVVRNEVHDVPSSALRIGGNDHVIARNEIHHVVTESDDQGAVDMWGDPTFRGIAYLNNYFHDVGSAWNGSTEVKLGQAAIRLDDAISGVHIAGNRFERCGSGRTGFGAVQIHGGKDNLIESNVFIACSAAVSFSAWKAERWTNFVAGRLEKKDIDAALYVRRYPALASLAADPNTVTLRGNLAIDTPLLRRGHAAVTQENNRVLTNAPPPRLRQGDYGPKR